MVVIVDAEGCKSLLGVVSLRITVEVGRPRQRLLLGDDRLRKASPADLATTAQSLFGNAPQPASR